MKHIGKAVKSPHIKLKPKKQEHLRAIKAVGSTAMGSLRS